MYVSGEPELTSGLHVSHRCSSGATRWYSATSRCAPTRAARARTAAATVSCARLSS